MKKETKFWKRGIKALLAIGLLTSLLIPTTAMANEYVTPSNGETEEDSIDVSIRFLGINEQGHMIDAQRIEKKNVKLGISYKDAGIEFPTSEYEGLTFITWVDGSGRNVTEDSLIDYASQTETLYPKFDKIVASAVFNYPTVNNEIKQVSKTCIMEHGSTYRDLLDKYRDFMIDNMSKEEVFTGWELGFHENLDNELNMHGSPAFFEAGFGDKKVVEMYYEYYDTRGVQQIETKSRFVSSNTTLDELYEEINKLPLPETVEGLRTNGWEKNNGSGIVVPYSRVYMKPNYENYIVRFMVDDSFRPVEEKISTRGAAAWFDETKIDTVYAVVAEPGETVSIPEIKEYTNINWVASGMVALPEGDSLVINDHTTFLGYGDKVDTPVVNPDDGDNDNNGAEVPDVTLPEDEINNAVNEVKNAVKGETVTVDMKDNVTLPVEVLESARGKDVEVVFNMGAYSWSINGLDITTDTLKAINLEVKLNANAISADVVKTLAGDRPTMQLSLSHNGEFGFKAKLQINLGAEHKGKYGNLYYYNKDGKLEFMNAGKIDANGNVSLEFTHASDYVVVIDEKSMEPKNTVNPIQDTSSTVGTNGIAGMLLLAVLGGTCYLTNKKLKA